MIRRRRPTLLGAAACFASGSLLVCHAHAAPLKPAGAAVLVGVSYSPGLGNAIAKRFAEGGLKVGIIGRQPERLEACKRDILQAVPGAEIECVAADATDPEAVKAAFSSLRAAHGEPEALVCNLSGRPVPPTKVADVTPERLESDWRTGPYAALLCVHEVLPAMQRRGAGTIVFTGASASLRGSPKFGSFAVAKGGLRCLAQSLAKEVGPDGIHVAHVVVDGMVDMPVINQFVPDAPKGRLLDPAAAAVVHGRADQRRRTAGIGAVGRGEGGIAILANRRGPILGRSRGHAVASGGGTSGNRECGRAGEQGIFLHGTPNAVGPEHCCPGPRGQLRFVGAIKQFADWHRIADQPNGRVSGWIPAPCGSPGPSLWPSRSSPTSSS